MLALWGAMSPPWARSAQSSFEKICISFYYSIKGLQLTLIRYTVEGEDATALVSGMIFVALRVDLWRMFLNDVSHAPLVGLENLNRCTQEPHSLDLIPWNQFHPYSEPHFLWFLLAGAGRQWTERRNGKAPGLRIAPLAQEGVGGEAWAWRHFRLRSNPLKFSTLCPFVPPRPEGTAPSFLFSMPVLRPGAIKAAAFIMSALSGR